MNKLNHTLLGLSSLLMGFGAFAQSDDKTEFQLLETKPHSGSLAIQKTADDNCSNATTLTVDAGCVNGTTTGNTVETGEAAAFPCTPIGGGGVTPRSTWYRVNAGSLSEMNITINRANVTNCGYHVAVYGPFAPGGGCLPTTAQSIYCEDILDAWDPGFHFQISSLTANQDYLIQIINEDCGGGNPRTVDYCIGAFSVQSNNTANSASVIDQCGITFNGTNSGYSPTNGLPGNENLDGNAGTTCGGCTAGDDVAYVVNNDSWFSFCATAAGTWNVDFNSITNCYAGNGLQMTIFRGTAGNLTQIENAPSPSLPGSSWTSANFSVAAGECIYMVVDGFAGDQCDYAYVLNNVTGGCNLVLPVDLIGFTGEETNIGNVLTWETSSETNNDYFILEHSSDGVLFKEIGTVASNGTDGSQYQFLHKNFNAGTNYYKLKQKDFNGMITDLKTIAITNSRSSSNDMHFYPNPNNTGNGTLEMSAEKDGNVPIQIYDVTGRIVYNVNENVTMGINRIPLSINTLETGTYIIKTGVSEESIKLIIE